MKLIVFEDPNHGFGARLQIKPTKTLILWENLNQSQHETKLNNLLNEVVIPVEDLTGKGYDQQ
jgi:hypothetical protein